VRGGRAWSRGELDAALAKLAAMHDPLEPAVAKIVERIEADDAAGVVAAFRASTVADPQLARMVENAVNRLGYKLLGANKLDDAIAVFQLNVDAFPAAANTWDSLAEAHMMKGNTALAIRYYEKAVELDPKNTNAAKTIEKLKAGRK
jgi:tetratricopeptide (TPR) repeat protein